MPTGFLLMCRHSCSYPNRNCNRHSNEHAVTLIQVQCSAVQCSDKQYASSDGMWRLGASLEIHGFTTDM